MYLRAADALERRVVVAHRLPLRACARHCSGVTGCSGDRRVALADAAGARRRSRGSRPSAASLRPWTACSCSNSAAFCSLQGGLAAGGEPAPGSEMQRALRQARRALFISWPSRRMQIEEVPVVGEADEARDQLAVARSCRSRSMPWIRCSTSTCVALARRRAPGRCARARSCRAASRSGSHRPGRPAPSPKAWRSRNSRR